MTLNNTTTTLLVTTIVTLLLSSLAWGHAAAQISSPANGAELTQSPKELSIQFNGAAKLVSLTIVDSVGNADKLDISEAKAVDGLISVQISPLQPESYEVTWRAMGADGHITAGTFKFAVIAPDQ